MAASQSFSRAVLLVLSVLSLFVIVMLAVFAAIVLSWLVDCVNEDMFEFSVTVASVIVVFALAEI